jgi:nucleoside-diphosphate-sugar epimerase
VRVLVTGHDGYIGRLLTCVFTDAGHEVTGLDSGLYDGCDFGPPAAAAIPELRLDVRDVQREHLDGYDAVVHLAGISNDPLGSLEPEVTYEINRDAAVQLARVAKAAGVGRFLFSSSCSLYGSAGEDFVDEDAEWKPVTPYGWSKVLAEQELTSLADNGFSPVFLRSGTAYGVSPRLRGDLVVNNLVGYAVATGEVRLKSDGSPWRPLVHVEDISRAFLAALEAPREAVHAEAFNVGATGENYRIRDVARLVEEEVAGSRVGFAAGAGADTRDYRVSCDKIRSVLPAFQPRWTVRDGIRELSEAFTREAMTVAELEGDRLQRLGRVLALQQAGVLDERLRRLRSPVALG